MTKQYDFDRLIDRKGTDCVKFDVLEARYGVSNLIPLWVADMDFATPDFIIDALKERLDHPVLGYPTLPQRYYDSIIRWVEYKHGWNIRKEWITYIPGIVKGIGMVVQAFTQPGDRIIIQPPVYHPFRLIPQNNGREIVENPLILDEAGYRMDFEQLETVLPGAKLLILCNPHNPGGVVWDVATLRRLAEVCHRHGVLVVSDEIHADMIHEPNKHIPFATVSPEAASNSITFMSPSKTFNIAGVVSSYAIVPDEKVRHAFFRYLEASEFNYAPIFPIVATIAAYEQGKEWLNQLMAYIQNNTAFVEQYLNVHLPSIKVYPVQASFLLWLDCRELDLSQEELNTLFVEKAGLALNDGAMFGRGGEGFMRLNIGCPQAVLKEALDRLRMALVD